MAYILRATGCPGGCLGGTDPCASTAPLPTLKVSTGSASKTKCGFAEFGTPSSPPKIYLTKTASGTGSESVSTLVNAYSGADSYDRATCGLTQSALRSMSDSSGSLGTAAGGPDSYDGFCNLYYGDSLFPQPGGGTCNSPGVSATVTATVTSWNWSGVGGTWSGVPTSTLSSEYTTALLTSDAVAAVGSYTGFATGTVGLTPIASFDLDGDELTASVKEGEYYFLLPTLTGASCYKLEWNETFTPESGSPTTTARSYLWNGTDTVTSTRSIGVPGTQGTTRITGLVASFACA